MKKKYLLAVTLALLLFVGRFKETLAEFDPSDTSPVDLIVDGDYVEDQNIFIYQDRTYIPLRKVSETLDYQVDYDDESRDIFISNQDKQIKMNVNSKEYHVDDKKMEMDVYPILKGDRTLVPIRFVAEALGEEVIWNEYNRIVIIGEFQPNVDIEYEEYIEFPEYDLVMYVPEDFKDKIVVKYENIMAGYHFYTKENNELLGILSASESSVASIMDGKLLKYQDGIFTEFTHTSDVQYSPETQEEYLKLEEVLDQAIYNIRFVEGLKGLDSLIAEVKEVNIGESSITIDPVELISYSNQDRLKELGLTENDLPSGIMVYNQSEDLQVMKTDHQTIFELKPDDFLSGLGIEVDIESFKEKLHQNERLFEIRHQDGIVKTVKEIYIQLSVISH